MALKRFLSKLTTSPAEQARADLQEFCAAQPVTTSIADLEPRQQATVAGEVTSLRIVPAKDGSPWLEASVADGTGTLVVLWTGRRRIAGVRPGTRLVVSGRAAPSSRTGRPTLYNPVYTLLGG